MPSEPVISDPGGLAPSERRDGGPVASSSPVLRLTDVTRRYGGLCAVDGVSLEVAAGERRAVIGPNGAGKTTLFKVISREEPASEGRVELLGIDITRMPPHKVARLGLARTYQITRVFPALSVLENVVMAVQGARPGKFAMLKPMMKLNGIVDRARQAIERVDLSKFERAPAVELGHGQQRQLELGIALATEPTILLLDEPAAGLSSNERGLMRDLVADLPRDLTLLLIEHDMELALGLADRVTCLYNGATVAEGRPEEIKGDQRVQDIYLGRGD